MSDDAISVISNIVLTPKRDQTKNPNRELQRKETSEIPSCSSPHLGLPWTPFYELFLK
jgi:hypothetical protein